MGRIRYCCDGIFPSHPFNEINVYWASLSRAYFSARLTDLKGSLIRPQLRFLNKRPENLRPQNETIHKQKPKQGRKGKNDFYE
nr:hypothetical protein [Bacillus pumilus]